jgi:hypothetical protein
MTKKFLLHESLCMKHLFALLCSGMLICSLLAGCAADRPATSTANPQRGSSPLAAYQSPDFQPGGLVMAAVHTDTPVKVDGKLDEPVWQRAVAYPMHSLVKANVPNFPLQEQGEIRLAWDEHFIYVAGRFHDRDVVQHATQDNIFLYSLGDTMEVFLKPRSKHWYWEFYGSPRDHKTTLFYPARGRFGLNPYPFVKNSGLKVASSVQGSLNDWSDLDQGYIIELAIPIEQIQRDSAPLAPGNTDWTILAARYNHSAYADTFQSELSTTPAIKAPNFHIFEWWASLRLEP